MTEHDVELAGQISAVISESGLQTVSGAGGSRPVQVLEIAIDALDAAAIRPFWQAVLGYIDEPGRSGPGAGLVDPLGQGPAVWFQQMDAPRPQRNRIHLDVSVPHDEAEARIRGHAGGGREADLRRGGPGVLGAGRRRGQRGLRHHLAGPGLYAGPDGGKFDRGGNRQPGCGSRRTWRLGDLVPQGAEGAGGLAAGRERGDRGPLHGHALDQGQGGDGGRLPPRTVRPEVLR